MSNPYPTMNVGSDTGALNVEGNQLLGAGAGVAIGLFIGKGKLIPAALGAGLGYLLSHTELFKKLTSPTEKLGFQTAVRVLSQTQGNRQALAIARRNLPSAAAQQAFDAAIGTVAQTVAKNQGALFL